jgi:hypothetical protein
MARQATPRQATPRQDLGGNRDSAARRPTPKRNDKDFWPTSPELQIALIRYVLPLLPQGPVWENAAGDGVLANALIKAGREVILSDIDPQRRGIMRLDFLKDDPPPTTRGSILITNPPFNMIDEFRARALQLLDVGHLKAVTFLYRADKANTQERIEDFNCAAHELTITARTKWVPSSDGTEKSPRWWFSWVTWLADQGARPSIAGSTAPCSALSVRASAKIVTGPSAAACIRLSAKSAWKPRAGR